jgi:hypothetical protein
MEFKFLFWLLIKDLLFSLINVFIFKLSILYSLILFIILLLLFKYLSEEIFSNLLSFLCFEIIFIFVPIPFIPFMPFIPFISFI